jgi:hypothetical protein
VFHIEDSEENETYQEGIIMDRRSFLGGAVLGSATFASQNAEAKKGEMVVNAE